MSDSTPRDRPIVLSVEQALSMPYATLRFVHLGWRVIRVEPTPLAGRTSKGDPNRYIGTPVAGEDRHSYFVAPNVGKEAMAINLKDAAGRAVLKRLIRELPVDVFCTNTMPSRHEGLGIDYEPLAEARPELIWSAISAMGAAYPDVPGYDPATQALCGYMDLTGEPDGPPLQCGPPLIDLKAGDEVFAQVLLAMLERERSGTGKKIDISMAHAAVSWLQTFTPMLDMGCGPGDIRRSGNEHRQFIPVNAYPTRDGYIFMAVGSDGQWARLTQQELFAALAEDRFRRNEHRWTHKEELHRRIGEITSRCTTAHVDAVLAAAAIPHSPITNIEDVADLPFVREAALKTTLPDGRVVRLPPPAVPTAHLAGVEGELPFAPGYGAHTDAVLAEIGLTDREITGLRENGVIA